MIRTVVAVVLAALAPLAWSQKAETPRTIQAVIAEQKARDAEAAASIASHGQLLYDADADKKTWGQYCADSQRLTDRGEFRRAIRSAAKALYLGERESNRTALAYAMRDLAYVYSFAGDLDRAQEWALKALPAAGGVANPNVDTGNELVAPVRKVLGDIATRRGRHDEALEHYEKALEAASLFSSQKQAIRIAMGAAQLRRGNLAEAKKMLGRETDVSDAALAAIARRGLGEVALAEGNAAEAKTHFAASARAAREAKNSYAEMWAHFGLARARQAFGDAAAAAEALDRALELAEALRGEFRVAELKSGFFGQVQEIFDFAIAAAAQAGDAERALRLSEQSRARAALDMVRNRAKDRSALAAAVRAQDPLEVAKGLPGATVVVVYHALPQATLAWTLRRGGIEMKRIALARGELERQVGRYRESLVANSPAAPAQSRALHAALVAPLGIRKDELVVFVPHRSLHVAPLHALSDGEAALVERHAVAYALSVSALAESLARTPSSQGGLLALGNPDLGDPQLDLPASEAEVRAIAQLAGTSPYLRKEASAERFRSASATAGIIHVAAHATVDEIDPLYSTVRLAAGDIEAHELYGMDLRRVGLVALSACSSGLGRVSHGDEFEGFKRSFLAAGARTLLVSLWPVADDSTARLMQSFYRHRQAKGAAEALRLAQLELLRAPDDSAPVFWAPFILVGDWR